MTLLCAFKIPTGIPINRATTTEATIEASVVIKGSHNCKFRTKPKPKNAKIAMLIPRSLQAASTKIKITSRAGGNDKINSKLLISELIRFENAFNIPL
jgi:hypothetical protein